MFSFVTVSFGVCWLPYHVYFIYSYHNPWVRNFLVRPLFSNGYHLMIGSDFSSVFFLGRDMFLNQLKDWKSRRVLEVSKKDQPCRQNHELALDEERETCNCTVL